MMNWAVIMSRQFCGWFATQSEAETHAASLSAAYPTRSVRVVNVQNGRWINGSFTNS